MNKSKKHKVFIIVGGLLLLAIIAAGGMLLYQSLTRSFQVVAPQGPVSTATEELPAPPEAADSIVGRMLWSAGLNAEPVLGDTAISGHINRLENSEVSEQTLIQYANDLIYLNEYTAENGKQIPTDFWDVRSDEMIANGWDEYNIVHQIAQVDSEPYLRLLTKGYGRFRQFKDAEESGEDTGLDAALDMMALVDTYYAAVAGAPPLDDAVAMENYTDAKLLVWQSLVAGSTRTNPLTKEPMFSHSIFARDNVGTMYQYDIDREMGIAKVWGVSGFAPQYVGIPENNNQVEHMSISMILQIVLDESVTVLDGIEEEKALLGQADKREANADMALNNAIHNEFAPIVALQGPMAVERLRCVLKSSQSNPDC